MKKMLFSLCFVFLIVFAFMFLSIYVKNNLKVDITNYNRILSNIKKNNQNSKLLIFPDNNDYITDLKYDKKTGLINDHYYLYITATYDAEEYNKEIDRITNIFYNKKIFKNGNTYVSIYDRAGIYEYIIIDENKIIYIYNQFYEFDKTDINQKYKLNEFDDIRYGYNIYY